MHRRGLGCDVSLRFRFVSFVCLLLKLFHTRPKYFHALNGILSLNPFSTAVYGNLYLTLFSSDLPPNWACSPKGGYDVGAKRKVYAARTVPTLVGRKSRNCTHIVVLLETKPFVTDGEYYFALVVGSGSCGFRKASFGVVARGKWCGSTLISVLYRKGDARNAVCVWRPRCDGATQGVVLFLERARKRTRGFLGGGCRPCTVIPGAAARFFCLFS